MPGSFLCFVGMYDREIARKIVRLCAEEFDDVNSDGAIKRAYQLQTVKIETADGHAIDNNISTSMSRSDTVSINTVSDLFNLVKTSDKNFLPMESGKAVNSDGTLKAVYIDITLKTVTTNNSNYILSAYEKNNFIPFHLDEIINNNALLYANKEKTSKLISDSGLQLPTRYNSLRFDTIIHQSNNIVNTSEQNNQKYSVKDLSVTIKEMGVKSPFFSAWFGDRRANDNTTVNTVAVKEYGNGNDTGIMAVLVQPVHL